MNHWELARQDYGEDMDMETGAPSTKRRRKTSRRSAAGQSRGRTKARGRSKRNA